MLREIHNPVERALYTSCALGVHLNIDYESYGGTESIRCMRGGDVVFHSNRSDVISFLSGLHRKVQAVLALLSSEGIDCQDYDKAVISLSETVSPKRNLEVYKYWIYKNTDLVRELQK